MNAFMFHVVTPKGEAIPLGMITTDGQGDPETIAGQMLDRVGVAAYKFDTETGNMTYITTVSFEEPECNASAAEPN